MSATVVQLRPRAQRKPVMVSGSPLFADAWLAFPDSGRLRSSRKLSVPEWNRVAAEIGEDTLLACVRRYAAEDKEHRRECGAPGFHRWLNWGRWEHWLPVAVALAALPAVDAPIFPDAELRASFHDRFADAKARSWFDRCRWLAEAREVIAPAAKAEWIQGPFRVWAVANSISGVRFK